MHQTLTVFVEAKAAAGEQWRIEGAVGMAMDPFDEDEWHELIEEPCWRIAAARVNPNVGPHDAYCCDGSLTRNVMANPAAKWDYFEVLTEHDYEAHGVKPGDTTFAMLDPLGAWEDAGDSPGESAWNERFTALYRRWTNAGFYPVLVNYHS